MAKLSVKLAHAEQEIELLREGLTVLLKASCIFIDDKADRAALAAAREKAAGNLGGANFFHRERTGKEPIYG